MQADDISIKLLKTHHYMSTDSIKTLGICESFVSNKIGYEELMDVINEIKQNLPKPEDIVSMEIEGWFKKTYPGLDVHDTTQVKQIVDDDNISIIHSKDFSFAAICKDSIPVFRTGEKNIKTNPIVQI